MGVARNVKREHFTPKDLQDLLLSAADRENPRHHAGVRGVFNGNHGAGPMAYDLGLRGGPEQSKDGSDRIVQLEKNGNDAFK